jgi:hypothetical protein
MPNRALNDRSSRFSSSLFSVRAAMSLLATVRQTGLDSIEAGALAIVCGHFGVCRVSRGVRRRKKPTQPLESVGAL